jgi:Subtilase family
MTCWSEKELVSPQAFVRVTLSLLLFVGACHESPDPEGGSEAQSRSASWPMPTRYVGVLEPPRFVCVDELPWVARPLFGPDERALVPLLDRFCVYTWTGWPAGPAAFSQAFVDTHVRLDPDPNIVVPQAQLSQVRAERALQALGASLGGNSPPTGWSNSGVYVAIVDNTDSSTPGQPALPVVLPRQLHGAFMRDVVNAVRCPFGGPLCHESQFFAQAFPYDSSSVEPLTSGGELGSLGSLAAAIGESVARWKALDDGWHLVINMSLGWDPAFQWNPEFGELPGDPEMGTESGATETGSEPGEMPTSSGPYDLPASFDPYEMLVGSDASVPAPVQAVYAALAWAACEGALSIAAAGNNRGPRCEQHGPMAPASWEVHPLSVGMCEAFGLFPTLETDGSLVYAAGGLDPDDQPIANARLGSMPPRALHAHQVNVAGGHPDPLTGTSLAAAALSAIAAQLWSQRPGDSATQIMMQLDASGVPLGSTVDWGDSEGAPVHRIDAHAALNAAGVANPYLPRSSWALPGPSGSLAAAIDLMTASKTYTSVPPPAPPVHAPTQDTRCAPGWVTIHGNVALPILPDPHFDELRPQPTVPICPNCAIRRSTVAGVNTPPTPNMLYLEINPLFITGANPTTIEPTLIFRDPNGYHEFQLGPITSYQSEIEVDLDLDPVLGGWLNQNLLGVTTALLSVNVGPGSPTSWHIGVIDVVP